MSLRAWADRALRGLGIVLYHLGLARAVIWLTRRVPRVVLYHACEPAETDYTRGLASNVPPDVLAMHLRFYRRFYRVVEPEALATPRALPDRALCVTFDDGFRSVFEHAWPRLREQGIPAIVYLVAELLQPGRLLWVNELNWWLHRQGRRACDVVARALGVAAHTPPPRLVEAARTLGSRARIEVLLDTVRASFDATEQERCYAEPQHLDRAMLATMAAGGIRFGSHTAWHASLTHLAEVERRDEIARGRDAVRDVPGFCNSFAYPFGDADADTRSAARDAGFASLMEVGGISWPADPGRLARVPVQATTPAALFAELEVVAPIKGVAKRLLEARDGTR